jgi:broad specificity phosphatase PhoE
MFYLVRHCSTTENEQGICCSNKDSGLSIQGQKQAKLLSNYFSKKEIDVILSSSSLRSVQTANSIISTTTVNVQIFPELNERKVGNSYANLPKAELTKLRKSLGHNFCDPSQDWDDVEDTESDDLVFERILKVIKPYIESGKCFVCVTHAGVIKSFLHCCFQINSERAAAFKIGNGQIIVLANNIENIQMLEMISIRDLL